MKNKNTPFIVTKEALYYRTSNGLVHAVYKNRSCPRCVAHATNDEDGWNFINNVLKKTIKLQPNEKLYYMYRCPNNGTYNRSGNVGKKRGRVVYVGIRTK